jgi:hypothetical protein
MDWPTDICRLFVFCWIVSTMTQKWVYVCRPLTLLYKSNLYFDVVYSLQWLLPRSLPRSPYSLFPLNDGLVQLFELIMSEVRQLWTLQCCPHEKHFLTLSSWLGLLRWIWIFLKLKQINKNYFNISKLGLVLYRY